MNDQMAIHAIKVSRAAGSTVYLINPSERTEAALKWAALFISRDAKGVLYTDEGTWSVYVPSPKTGS